MPDGAIESNQKGVCFLRRMRLPTQFIRPSPGSVYGAEAKLALQGTHPKTPYEGIDIGTAGRCGQQRSAEAISELLNGALTKAYANIPANPAPRKARIFDAESAESASSNSAESPDEQVRTAEDLLRIGL